MTTLPTEHVVVGDLSMAFHQCGSGEPLVLLHGIGSGARSWRQQVASLSGRHRVIAWDAPGYGGSPE